MAFLVAVLLTVTSVIWDFPIKTGFETSAADTVTVYYTVNGIAKNVGATLYYGADATTYTSEIVVDDPVSGNDHRFYSFHVDVELNGDSRVVRRVGGNTTGINQVGWYYDKSLVTTSNYNYPQVRPVGIKGDMTFTFMYEPSDPTTHIKYEPTEGGTIIGGTIPIFDYTTTGGAAGNRTYASDYIYSGGTYITGATAVEEDGYKFTGWYDEANNLVCEDANFTPSGDYIKTATYTAKFAKIIPITYTTTDPDNVTLTASTTDYYIVGADDSEQAHISDNAVAIAVPPNANALRTNAVYWVNQQNEGLALGGTTTDANNNKTEEIAATLDKTIIISEIKKALQENSDLDNYTFTAIFSKYYTKKITWDINGGNYGSNSPQNSGNSWINFNVSNGKVTISHRNTATAKDGGKFDKWVVKGDNNSYDYSDSTGNIGGTYNPNMPWTDFIKADNYTVISYFSEIVINVNIEQDDNENGSIKYNGTTISTPTTLKNPIGTLTATPANGSLLFDYWEIVSPDGAVDVSKKDPSLDLTTLNPDDDTKITAHYKSSFSITVEQNNDDYGSMLYQNGNTSQTINSVTTLSESTGTLTAQPKEGFALVNWSVKYPNGNEVSFTDETIDLSTIGADNGTSITANYKIADGWVQIIYEVVNTGNTINYPVKLKFIDSDDSTLVGDYSRTNSTMPYLTEIVHVSAGEEAKGVEAVMKDPKTKYDDDQYYKFMGWEEENGYLFTEETSFKPSKDYLEYCVENGTYSLIYRAESRQTKNFYLVVQYNENIDDGSNIYNTHYTSSNGLTRTTPITSVIQYIGYAVINSDGTVGEIHSFKEMTKDNNGNVIDKQSDYAFIPGAQIPLGYKFDYWEITGTGAKYTFDSQYFNYSLNTNHSKNLVEANKSGTKYTYAGNLGRQEYLNSKSDFNDRKRYVGGDAFREDIRDWAENYMYNSIGTGDSYSHTIYLTCYVEPMDCVIEITKHIDEAPEGFGQPQFIFKVEGRETTNYTTLDQTKMTQEWSADGKTATVKFVVPKGEYVVTEVDSLRYSQSDAYGVANSPGDNADKLNKTEIDSRTTIVPNVSGSNTGSISVTFLTGNGKAELTFDNKLSNHGKRSYSDSNVNHIGVGSS